MNLPGKNNMDWKPWIELVENDRVWDILASTPLEYKRITAAALSVAKWHPERGSSKRGGFGDCGWCEIGGSCGVCPVFQKNNCCSLSDSMWQKWIRISQSYSSKTTEIAQAADNMYLLLYDIYKEEYEKLIRPTQPRGIRNK